MTESSPWARVGLLEQAGTGGRATGQAPQGSGLFQTRAQERGAEAEAEAEAQCSRPHRPQSGEDRSK